MYTLTSKLRQNIRNENQAGPTLPFAKISGIISDYTLFSYWPIFPLSPETVPGVEPQETPKFFFKIPYVQYFPVTAQRSIRKLANRLCKPIDLRLLSKSGIFLMWKMLSLRGYARVWSINSISAILLKGSVTLLNQKIERYVSTNLSLIFVESPPKISGKRENYSRIANIKKYNSFALGVFLKSY